MLKISIYGWKKFRTRLLITFPQIFAIFRSGMSWRHLQWSTEAGKIPKYRIPKLRYSNRTEPNNTEPNLIVDENQYFPLFDNFFQFYCIFMWQFFKTCSILLHFSASKRSCFKQIQKFWGKNVQMIRFGISVSYRTEPNRIIPNRSFGIR